MSGGNVKYFELGPGTDALSMSPTQGRPLLLGSGVRLHQENSFDDFFDIRLFLHKAPLSVATSYAEPSGHK